MREVLVIAGIAMMCGCSSLVTLVEDQIPAMTEPVGVVLEEGRAEMRYRYCVGDACVDWTHEVREETLRTEDDDAIWCLVVYVNARYMDGTENTWLWPAEGSDPRCADEMAKLSGE